MNARRMINSNRRICMAELPEEMFVEAVEAIVKYEQDWIPTAKDTSLYIRPFMFTSHFYHQLVITIPEGVKIL